MVESSPPVASEDPQRERGRGFRSFLDVVDARVVPATLSKATLIDLSRTLESLVLQDGMPGIVVAGFQHARHWAPAEERYQRLAEVPGMQVMVFGAGALRAASVGGAEDGVARFTLTDDDPLCQEWFVLALTERFSAALFARDLTGLDQPDAEMDRPFATVWTFDPRVVQDLAAALAEALAATHPTAGRVVAEGASSHPPRDVPVRVTQQFTNIVFERLEADRRRLRRARQDLAESHREGRSRRRQQLERLRAVGAAAVAVANGLDDPLAAITAQVGRLRADSDVDERFHLADLIEIEVLRAGRIVDELRDFVSDRDLDLRPTDLGSWLGNLVVALREDGRDVVLAAGSAGSAGAAGLAGLAGVSGSAGELRTAAAGADGARETELPLDRHRLERAIGNLVDNAVEAPGRRQPVRIGLIADAHEIRIVVDDDGRGVADAVQPRLFEPFVTSKPNGAGTGLAIARAHVEDHGGRLELETTGPDGTRFALHLPIAMASAAGDASSGGTAGSSGGGAGSPPLGEANRRLRRALVLDEDASTRGLLEVLLRRDGWDVMITGDPDAAVEAARDGAFEVVLLDGGLTGGAAADGSNAVPVSGSGAIAALRALEAVQPGVADRAAFLTTEPPESGEIDGHPVLREPFAWTELSTLLGQLHPPSV